MHFGRVFAIFIHQKPQKTCFGSKKKIKERWKILFFQKRPQVGWNYPKIKKMDIGAFFTTVELFSIHFWRVKITNFEFKSVICQKCKKKTYFGLEFFSKSNQKIIFSGKFTDELSLTGK